MTKEEVNSLKNSIADARKKIEAGLIQDREILFQLYRMIAYYEEKIEKFEKASERKNEKCLDLTTV